MTCSTCDGYEFVPDAAGVLVDCPDCRAIDPRPLVWCPVHSVRAGANLRCPKCVGEATRGAEILLERAAAAVAAAAAAVEVPA